jgi:hypothetical protein
MSKLEISNLTGPELMALKTAIDARLEDIRQRHIEEAAALGLTVVDGNSPRKRRRRNSSEQDEPEYQDEQQS